jgi:hypothetical protein
MPFLHFTSDVVIEDLVGHPATGSEGEVGGRSYELHLGSKMTFYEALGQTIGLEIMKQTVGSFVRIIKMSVKTLWRSQPPSKRNKRLHTA